jgi:hypothetical protein
MEVVGQASLGERSYIDMTIGVAREGVAASAVEQACEAQLVARFTPGECR